MALNAKILLFIVFLGQCIHTSLDFRKGAPLNPPLDKAFIVIVCFSMNFLVQANRAVRIRKFLMQS